MISLLRVPAALFALACGLANFATAQVVVLDNFNATGATGKVITTPASTWIGSHRCHRQSDYDAGFDVDWKCHP